MQTLDAGAGTSDLAILPPVDLGSAPDLLSIGYEGVRCGGDVCVDAEFCCASLGTRSCMSPGGVTCLTGKHVRCDGPEDCGGGEKCCASYDGTVCRDNCGTPATFCHTTADCGEADYCCPTQSGYATCSNNPC